MEKEERILEKIADGGEGSEAAVAVELRNEFPGIGGKILTRQTLAVAARQENNRTAESGHILFLKHALFKKLDDYFRLAGKYEFPHISRPLGSSGGGVYFYEWVFGAEGFPWTVSGDDGADTPVILSEWKEFVDSFNAAGIDLQKDCVEPDGGCSKNIIHQLYRTNDLWTNLNCLWQRIDFGPASAAINWEKLGVYLKKEKENLTNALGTGRWELMDIICRRFSSGGGISQKEIGKLEILVREYRLSTLRHLTASPLVKVDAVG